MNEPELALAYEELLQKYFDAQIKVNETRRGNTSELNEDLWYECLELAHAAHCAPPARPGWD